MASPPERLSTRIPPHRCTTDRESSHKVVALACRSQGQEFHNRNHSHRSHRSKRDYTAKLPRIDLHRYRSLPPHSYRGADWSARSLGREYRNRNHSHRWRCNKMGYRSNHRLGLALPSLVPRIRRLHHRPGPLHIRREFDHSESNRDQLRRNRNHSHRSRRNRTSYKPMSLGSRHSSQCRLYHPHQAHLARYRRDLLHNRRCRARSPPERRSCCPHLPKRRLRYGWRGNSQSHHRKRNPSRRAPRCPQEYRCH